MIRERNDHFVLYDLRIVFKQALFVKTQTKYHYMPCLLRHTKKKKSTSLVIRAWVIEQ